MANDPRDHSGQQLKLALHALGRDRARREELIAWLQKQERRWAYSGSLRDDVMGPIIDALHDDEDRYERELANGLRFRFLYRTKIAREFLLAAEARPTHVWEPQTTRLLLHLAALSTGEVLVGGAYSGDQAILVAHALAPLGRSVHGFEPNTDQASVLEENAALNGLGNVHVHRMGLWERSGANLRLEGFDSFANAVEQAADDNGFPTVTIDDYCAKAGVRVGLVMLDIEGAELQALRGACQTLATDHPAVVFEVHRDYVDWSQGLLATPICRLLTDMGYHIFAVRDINGNQAMEPLPIELIPADRVWLAGPPHGFNMVAVADDMQLAGAGFRVVVDVSPKLLRHKDPALHHPLDGWPGEQQ